MVEIGKFKTIEDVIKFCEEQHYKLWMFGDNSNFENGKLCAYEIILDNLIDGFSKDGFKYTTLKGK